MRIVMVAAEFMTLAIIILCLLFICQLEGGENGNIRCQENATR